MHALSLCHRQEDPVVNTVAGLQKTAQPDCTLLGIASDQLSNQVKKSFNYYKVLICHYYNKRSSQSSIDVETTKNNLLLITDFVCVPINCSMLTEPSYYISYKVTLSSQVYSQDND